MGLLSRRLLSVHLFILLLAGIVMLFTPTNVSAQSVKQWEVVDLAAFTTSTSHNWDSFPLQVTFTHEGSGTSLTVDGYYDGESGGNQVWQVRFAPTLTGTWSWRSSSSDTRMNGIAGTINAVGSTSSDKTNNPNLRGHVKVNRAGDRPNRYFTYADGTEYFFLGDTNWAFNTSACGLSGPFNKWLNDRKAKGFTAIFSTYIRMNFTSNEGGTATSSRQFNDLNSNFFKQLDTRMQKAWDNGFVFAAVPTWLGDKFIPNGIPFSRAKVFSRYLISRYGAYNIIWSLTGEYTSSYSISQWNSLGNYVKDHDPYNHPKSIHPGTSTGSSSVEFHNSAWLDHNWIQSGHGVTFRGNVPSRIASDYKKSPTKPVVHSEGWYEGFRDGDTDSVRWQAWTAYLEGATAHAYGGWDVCDSSNSGLNFGGSSDMKHLGDFFKSIDWWKLEPSEICGNTLGNRSTTSRRCAASLGDTYVVYIPQGNSGTTVRVSNLQNGNYQARWWDPRNGGWTNITNGPSGVSSWTLPQPPNNRNQDWLMLLTQISSSTPTPSPTPITIPGDVDMDGDVDIFDYNILIADFGQSISPADIDKNGIVDIFDYNILVGNFGKSG